MNGRSAGGFRLAAPYASVDDGLLEIIILKSCTLMEFMPLFLQIQTGEHINNEKVTYFRAGELTIECDTKIATDLDGEEDPGFPLQIKCLPRKLKILGVDSSIEPAPAIFP
ncbi:MAG: hypothetical protein CVU89_09595 [Firmicutes bacterium HGW-Firmicutes-14]|nr:MAG: hypothetical protein CVU89_09595 [Firmicutes bacterium HGW-Firmicutes-14]